MDLKQLCETIWANDVLSGIALGIIFLLSMSFIYYLISFTNKLFTSIKKISFSITPTRKILFGALLFGFGLGGCVDSGSYNSNLPHNFIAWPNATQKAYLESNLSVTQASVSTQHVPTCRFMASPLCYMPFCFVGAALVLINCIFLLSIECNKHPYPQQS